MSAEQFKDIVESIHKAATLFIIILHLYWVSQNLPQICTESALVYRKSLLKQMQYRFAVNFGTLSIFFGIIKQQTVN